MNRSDFLKMVLAGPAAICGIKLQQNPVAFTATEALLRYENSMEQLTTRLDSVRAEWYWAMQPAFKMRQL